MARRKKIIRKKLREPDEFMSITERAYKFIANYLKPIIIGGIIVLVLVLSMILSQRLEKKKEVDANQKFDFAVQLYQQASSPYQEGPPIEYKNVLEKLDEVITKFPRTSSAKLSLLYKGNIYLRLAEFEKAIKEFQTFLQKVGNEKLYSLLALEGIGYAYEGAKDYDKALQTYQKILEMGESFQLANAYFDMGRCYEKLGKNEEALKNYKMFLKVSEKSLLANAVLRKVSLLEK